MKILAENDQLLSNYFYLPLLNSDLSLNVNLVEALGLEMENGRELEKNVRSLFTDIPEMESDNEQVLVNEDDRVLLNIPAFDGEIANELKEKIDTAFSQALPDKLAKILSNQFLTRNEQICSALLGRGKLLQIAPTSNEENNDPFPSNYLIKMVIREKESGALYLEKNGFDAFSKLSGWEQSFEELPVQWQHLF